MLLDLNLRDGSTPAANVARLLDAGAAVLVVSTIPGAEHVLATIEAGAAGYVTKDNDLPAGERDPRRRGGRDRGQPRTGLRAQQGPSA